MTVVESIFGAWLMMKVIPNILVSWIGRNDLEAADNEFDSVRSIGPIAATLQAIHFEKVELLYSYPTSQVEPYLAWLKKQFPIEINAHAAPLASPIDFGEIYEQANNQLARITSENVTLSILLSPGTPAMQAIWILLGKTHYRCNFYQSSIEQGVQLVDIPFDLSAEYLPAVQRMSNEKLNYLASADLLINPAFDNIITRNPLMKVLKAKAQILAEREVPVLIYGETGTGKELFARAIHKASNRSEQPFIPVNCGAIPSELVDSILFGHKRGSFTGAISDQSGVFEQANGGTLFLDEFGELGPNVQVRLLRVLQEGSIVPVGGTQERKVNVRLITATHRNLMESVANGSFREDLFYRIAVGVLHLPPIREREGDLSLLADSLMKIIGDQDPLLEHKNISSCAKNFIIKQSWRGNVRELYSTLLRAALWSQGDSITAADIQQSLFSIPEKTSNSESITLSQGVDLQQLIGDFSANYIRRALQVSGYNKTRAAQLLGLKNYQTLNNWMEKYGIS